MIAGGSGITPVYQTMMEIANMKEDKTELVLLFANRTEEDIVLRKEIDGKSDRIKVHYMLSNPPEGWKGYKGHVTHEILKEVCPNIGEETITLICGPKPMNHFLLDLYHEHYPKSIIFKF